MTTNQRPTLSEVGNPTRHFIKTCLVVGAVTPAIAGIVARFWLIHKGLAVPSWGETLLMIVLPTVFLVFPLYLIFSMAAMKFLPPTEHAPLFRRRMNVFSGALVGLTLPVVGTLYYLYLQGAASLILLTLPWFLILTTLGTLAGAGVGWLLDFSRHGKTT